MWFLVLLISFFAGLFGTLNLYGSIFIALPYLSQFGNKYNKIKNSYWITILIHSIFAALAMYLCVGPLKQFAEFIIAGYFIIPIFIVIGQKDNMEDEVRERIRGEEDFVLRESLRKANQQLIKNLELLAFKLEKLYSGEKVSITKADISNSAINLVQFRDKLPKDIYDKAFERYNYYQNLNDNGVLMDLAQFAMENRFMQMEFSQLLKRKISHEGDILDEVYVDENFELEEEKIENIEIEDFGLNEDDEDEIIDEEDDDEDEIIGEEDDDSDIEIDKSEDKKFLEKIEELQPDVDYIRESFKELLLTPKNKNEKIRGKILKIIYEHPMRDFDIAKNLNISIWDVRKHRERICFRIFCWKDLYKLHELLVSIFDKHTITDEDLNLLFPGYGKAFEYLLKKAHIMNKQFNIYKKIGRFGLYDPHLEWGSFIDQYAKLDEKEWEKLWEAYIVDDKEE